MRVCEHITELQLAIRELRSTKGANPAATIGFVPTMGYLHAGHESLLERAREHDDIVVLSIFVNPLQFGPNEDYDRYPRNTEQDLQLATRAGVDVVFLPSVDEMYPHYPLATKVTIGDLSTRLCGAARPGHFDGVATVVTKLFHIVNPDRAYFGQKDIQQIAILQQMVQDLNMSVQLIPCPTLREIDGLALSSRNVYLTPDERAQAVILSQALNKVDEWLTIPNMTAKQLEDHLISFIKTAPLANVEYVTILNYPTLQPIEEGTPNPQLALNNHPFVIALAVKFGRTRLIDNRILGGASHA